MRLTGKFVLPQDLVLQPVLELGDQFRHTGAEPTDFAVSRKQARAASKVVDAEAAALIRQFERPTTIAVAVARFSRAQSQADARNQVSPERILEDALPLMRSLIAEGMLVAAEPSPSSTQSSLQADPLAPGTDVDRWTVGSCIQALEDTELYKVRGLRGEWGALKIARLGDSRAHATLAREARLLGETASSSLPKLLAEGTCLDRPYLVTEWFAGIDAEAAAAELRRAGGAQALTALAKLGSAILDAYVELHERGLLHGDIHPRNLLVDRKGTVKVLDLGYAAQVGRSSSVGRAGVGFFYEPEFAAAALRELPPPAASLAGEQYALAALLYLLLTGAHTQNFSLERRQMLGQIATGPMVPLERRGLPAWPEAERVLGRALGKDPAARFPSTREFAEAWRAVGVPAIPAAVALPDRQSKLAELRRALLRRSAIGGEWMREGFRAASVAPMNSGCAGLAIALGRIALAASDAELIATADVWSSRAIRELDTERAFAIERALDPEEIPTRASLHHQPPGVYATHALLAAARGDLATQLEAISAYIAWGREALAEPRAQIDLTLGFSGSLLGAALLLDSCRSSGEDAELASPAAVAKARLLSYGKDLDAHLGTILDGFAPIGAPASLANTAVAHGWAGLLYPSLCWRAASGQELPSALRMRLEQLASRAEPVGRGLYWPWGRRAVIPGWCNGSAGFVFLWTEAFRALGDAAFLDLAAGAAWTAWETATRDPTLCCGMTGQAYALLNLHRHTGDAVWLRRAETLASRAAEAFPPAAAPLVDAPPESRPGSLYYGLAGLAALGADLERPLEARMPFFERD
jgi:serine/threonine-protein kinase